MDEVRHGDLGVEDLEGPHVGVGVDHLAARDDDAPLAAYVDVAGPDAGGLGGLHAQRVADVEGEGEILPSKDLVANVEGEGAGRVVPEALVADHAVELSREVCRVVALGHVLPADRDGKVSERDSARGARRRGVEAVEHRDGDDRAVRQVNVGADRDHNSVDSPRKVRCLLNVARDESWSVGAQGLHIAGHRIVDGANVTAPRGQAIGEARDVAGIRVGGVVGEGVGQLDHRLWQRREARRHDLDAGRGLRLDGVADVKGEGGDGRRSRKVNDHRKLNLLIHGIPHSHACLTARRVGAKVGSLSAGKRKVPREALRVGEASHGDAHGAMHGSAEHGHVGRQFDRDRVLRAGPRGALPDVSRYEASVLGHQDARALHQRGLGNGAAHGGEVRVDRHVWEHGLLGIGVDNGEREVDLLPSVGGRGHAHLQHAGALLPFADGRPVDHGPAQRRDRGVHLALGERVRQAADGEVGPGLDGDVELETELELVLVARVVRRLVDSLGDPRGAAHEEGRGFGVRGHEDARELGLVLYLVHRGVGGARQRCPNRQVLSGAAAPSVHDGELHRVQGVRRLIRGEVDYESARGRVEPAIVAVDDVGHHFRGRHRTLQVADSDLGAAGHRDGGIELHGDGVGRGVGVRVALPGAGPEGEQFDLEGGVAARCRVQHNRVEAHGRRRDHGGLRLVDAGRVLEDKAKGIQRASLGVASDADGERAGRLVPVARAGKHVGEDVGPAHVGLVGHDGRDRRHRSEGQVHAGRLAVHETRDCDDRVNGEVATRDAQGHVGRERHRDRVVCAGVPVALMDTVDTPIRSVDQPRVVDEVQRHEFGLHHPHGVAVAQLGTAIVYVGATARRIIVARAINGLVCPTAWKADAAVHRLALKRHALALGAVEAGGVDARSADADGGRRVRACRVVQNEREHSGRALSDAGVDPQRELLGGLVPASLARLPDAALPELAGCVAAESNVARLGGASVQVRDGDERLRRQRDVGADGHADRVGRVRVQRRLPHVPLKEHGRVHLERGEVAGDKFADGVTRARVPRRVHVGGTAGKHRLLVKERSVDGDALRLDHDGRRVLSDDGVGDREGNSVLPVREQVPCHLGGPQGEVRLLQAPMVHNLPPLAEFLAGGSQVGLERRLVGTVDGKISRSVARLLHAGDDNFRALVGEVDVGLHRDLERVGGARPGGCLSHLVHRKLGDKHVEGIVHGGGGVAKEHRRLVHHDVHQLEAVNPAVEVHVQVRAHAGRHLVLQGEDKVDGIARTKRSARVVEGKYTTAAREVGVDGTSGNAVDNGGHGKLLHGRHGVAEALDGDVRGALGEVDVGRQADPDLRVHAGVLGVLLCVGQDDLGIDHVQRARAVGQVQRGGGAQRRHLVVDTADGPGVGLGSAATLAVDDTSVEGGDRHVLLGKAHVDNVHLHIGTHLSPGGVLELEAERVQSASLCIRSHVDGESARITIPFAGGGEHVVHAGPAVAAELVNSHVVLVRWASHGHRRPSPEALEARKHNLGVELLDDGDRSLELDSDRVRGTGLGRGLADAEDIDDRFANLERDCVARGGEVLGVRLVDLRSVVELGHALIEFHERARHECGLARVLEDAAGPDAGRHLAAVAARVAQLEGEGVADARREHGANVEKHPSAVGLEVSARHDTVRRVTEDIVAVPTDEVPGAVGVGVGGARARVRVRTQHQAARRIGVGNVAHLRQGVRLAGVVEARDGDDCGSHHAHVGHEGDGDGVDVSREGRRLPDGASEERGRIDAEAAKVTRLKIGANFVRDAGPVVGIVMRHERVLRVVPGLVELNAQADVRLDLCLHGVANVEDEGIVGVGQHPRRRHLEVKLLLGLLPRGLAGSGHVYLGEHVGVGAEEIDGRRAARALEHRDSDAGDTRLDEIHVEAHRDAQSVLSARPGVVLADVGVLHDSLADVEGRLAGILSIVQRVIVVDRPGGAGLPGGRAGCSH